MEKETIEQAIASCDGNIPKAAALLEISPSTIYRKKQGWRAWSESGLTHRGMPAAGRLACRPAAFLDG
ncbi:helix-turn-helix domain-containing protein [Aeromonas caviae]|uniref:helix-turn-helix domain-containing protein n=1 Tax=Aeromonas caviae TaxID=648 RepID=UPI003F78B498